MVFSVRELSSTCSKKCKGTKGVGCAIIHLTNCSRGIRNAWHFYYALVLVFKAVCGASALRCSPLNKALCFRGNGRF
ncbi:DUF3265 domain-containing protein [Vibrio alginolyticus]|nr:DUF3265 domain-containing protein [Vibrio alginolyticus]